MAEATTKPTGESVENYLSGIEDEQRRTDCVALVELMRKVTGEPAVMWGGSIVGFGMYQYTYESGRQGTSCRTGISSRKRDITINLVAGGPDRQALLTKLGKHKMGKACLYIRRLADIDRAILERLIRDSVAEVHRRYG